jgi:hypothetical protein
LAVLIEQRQAENGSGLAQTDVSISVIRGLDRGIVQNNNLAGVQDVVEHGLRQHALGHGLVHQTYDHRVAACRSFRLDTRLFPAPQNQ